MKKVKTTRNELKQLLKEEIKYILNETEEVPPMGESKMRHKVTKSLCL